jgi:photosystem II stability/assembly factor-like uncharacterized protein
MKVRTLSTGLCAPICLLLLSAPLSFRLFGEADTKLPFTCTADDLQWAGMTCSEKEPCPIFLELSSISSAGSKIFVAGDIHSAQTTLYSVLLRSEDAGATWQEPVGRVRGDVLDHIQFENFETGWVSGQRVIPLPGDPFFLITHDGGKSWRKVPVLAEGSPGMIQKYRFDSAMGGKLIIDHGKGGEDEPRFQLFETKDGAETWTAERASAEAIKNAPAPEESSLWRLTAEKGGKKLLVERRGADKWTVAASFTIQIAECREP